MTEYRFLSLSSPIGQGRTPTELEPELLIAVGKSTRAVAVPLTKEQLFDIAIRAVQMLRTMEGYR